MPEVDVTAPAPRFGGRGFFRRVLTGIGNLFRTRVASAPNDVRAPEATCTSAEADRLAHAHMDVKLGLAGGKVPRRTGQEARVEYDDGGSEVWIVSYPYFTKPLNPIPKPDTLRCP